MGENVHTGDGRRYFILTVAVRINATKSKDATKGKGRESCKLKICNGFGDYIGP